mmetsp:Transcript_8837/g.23081  ORF Transcript_8837/g.23081 Transcript_8837/m.23081 type:complete len:336 (+) Transcript_8837:18-1025(+)
MLRLLSVLVAVSPLGGVATQAYDYSKTTSENYNDPTARLRREFFSARVGLDYRHHMRYSLERQAVQDGIIRQILSFEDMQRGKPVAEADWMRVARGARVLRQPRQPWCVFTAGAMGAGKTHVMCALDRHGLMPINNFVRIDMDRIRDLLPEMPEYVKRDKRSAGHMTQLEAGAIAEIVSEEAFARGLNVWIDSSMKNSDWWATELARLRRVYPHRLCIMHITADWEAVQKRERRRGEQTGRRIPADVLLDAFRQVPRSVARLAPMVDECIVVDNNARQPRFRSSNDVRSLLRVCREVGGDCESRQLELWLPGFELPAPDSTAMRIEVRPDRRAVR